MFGSRSESGAHEGLENFTHATFDNDFADCLLQSTLCEVNMNRVIVWNSSEGRDQKVPL
jgi:hypothetical protein